MELKVTNMVEVWESSEEGTAFTVLRLKGDCGCQYTVKATPQGTLKAHRGLVCYNHTEDKSIYERDWTGKNPIRRKK